MSKKYIFDTDTLLFKEAKFSLKDFLTSFTFNIIITLSIGVLLGYVLSQTIKTPRARDLEKENQKIIFQIAQINKNVEHLYQGIVKISNHDRYSYRTVLGMKDRASVFNAYNIGGSTKYQYLRNYPHNTLLRETNLKLDFVLYLLKSEGLSLEEIKDMAIAREEFINARPSIIPILRKNLKRIGPFGWRIHPVYKIRKFHEGADLISDRGTPVYATADGIVFRADASSKGYGNHIRIAHGYGYITLYAHLSKILVKPGQFVKRGQLIGLVGSTGLSTGPHLHYEVRVNGKPRNPVNYFYNDITDSQYEQLIKEAATDEK